MTLNERELAMVQQVQSDLERAKDRHSLVMRMIMASHSLNDKDTIDLATGAIVRYVPPDEQVPF